MEVQTPIDKVYKTREMRFDDVPVQNFWLKQLSPELVRFPRNDCRSRLEKLVSAAEKSVICVASEALSDAQVIRLLRQAAERGNRIYLLVNRYDPALEELTGCCLIRTGISNIGSFALACPNTAEASGLLFAGPLTEQALAFDETLLLNLGKAQGAALYRHFCHHFWHTAKQEILERGGQPIPVCAKPVDVPRNAKDCCDAAHIKEVLGGMTSGMEIFTSAVTSRDYMGFTGLRESRVYTSLTGNNNEHICRIGQAGNSVLAVAGGVHATVIKNADHLYVIPKANVGVDDLFFALDANAKQRLDIERWLLPYRRGADYSFRASDRRSELAGRTVLRVGEQTEFQICSETSVSLGEQRPWLDLVSKEKVELREPTKDMTDDGKSVTIQFSWTNVPFCLPQPAQEHKLYQEWRQQESRIQDHLDKLIGLIAAVESRDSTFVAIKRLLAGNKVLLLQDCDELSDFRKREFSRISKDDLKRIVSRINELGKKLTDSQSDIDEEERKAKIDAEINELELQESARRQEKEAAERQLESLEKKRTDGLRAFCEKYEIPAERMNAFKDDHLQKAGQKNRKANPEEASKAQAVLDELKVADCEKDIREAQNRKSDLESEIKRVQQQKAQKEYEKQKSAQKRENKSPLNNMFKHGQKVTISSGNTATKPEALAAPNLEPLPEVGELKTADRKDYLAIRYWEEFEKGQSEATRLRATLCAFPTERS
jgi:hypothetical protein